MSSTPRHEGARVWPSKPRLLLAAVLFVTAGVAYILALNLIGAPGIRLLVMLGYGVALAGTYLALDGWPRRGV